MTGQLELFPTSVVIHPTPALDDGESFLAQCAYCGLLICAVRKVPLQACPACEHTTWWEQGRYCGPFRPANAPHAGELNPATCAVPTYAPIRERQPA